VIARIGQYTEGKATLRYFPPKCTRKRLPAQSACTPRIRKGTVL